MSYQATSVSEAKEVQVNSESTRSFNARFVLHWLYLRTTVCQPSLLLCSGKLPQALLSCLCSYLSSKDHLTLFARINKAWLRAARSATSWAGDHSAAFLQVTRLKDENPYARLVGYNFRSTF